MVPALTAIARAIDTIAKAEVTTAMVLTGADPDRVRIVRINRHRADGINALIIEDRRPGRAGILGAPDTAGTDTDNPGRRIILHDLDIADPAGHQGRADRAEFQTGECTGIHRTAIAVIFRLCTGRLRQNAEQDRAD